MNIISPLTLLIVPIVGSLIIVSYPYNSAPPYLHPLNRTTALRKGEKVVLNNLSMQALAIGNGDAPVKANALNELIDMPITETKNSSLKKIAIITSLINFIISIIL